MVKTLPYSYHHIWKVAYPILISLIMEQLIGMTDTAFLGRVGEVELGASAIAGVYCMAIFVSGMGFGIGSQIIIARRNGEGNYKETGNIFYHGVYFLLRRNGEGNYKETGNIFYHGVYFLLGLAVIIIALSEMVSPWALHRMVSSPEIADAAMDYVRWRLVGFIFAFVTVMFRAFYVGTTQTRTLTLNSIVMVLSNVVFNWILVFGHLGFPALGIAGAAIGSTLAELVSLIFFIVYTIRKTDCEKYGLNRRIDFSWSKLGSILSISVWTMIQNFLSVSAPRSSLPEGTGKATIRKPATFSTTGYISCSGLCPGYPSARLFLHIPQDRDQHIYRHPGNNRRFGILALGAVCSISVHHSGTYLLQRDFRDRKHPHGIRSRGRGAGHLYCLLHIDHKRIETARMGCVDN